MSRSPNAQRLVPCMPPLIEEETKPVSREDGSTNFVGTACENLVKVYFLSRGINIAEPHVDAGVDLLIEKPEGWVRGQVKKVVYENKLDYGHKKQFGNEKRLSRYNFYFQGCAQYRFLSDGTKVSIKGQKGPEVLDYFYHVLLTPYRQLIWETPVSLIPVREDGTFVHCTNPILDRHYWKRKKKNLDLEYDKLLLYSRYDPIIFKTHPDFFLKPEPPTLNNFFE